MSNTMAVYTWGANSHGQLGLGFESELCMTPQRITECSFAPQQVRCMRGGGGHVLILDTNGRVHACGWNNRGQLGLDSMQECYSVFQCIPYEFFADVPIQSIACGWDISGAITVTKRLYVWGSNAFQQLGICQRGFNSVRRPLPVCLPRDEVPQRISFGLRHCAILTESNVIYVFGRLRVMDPPPFELAITNTTLNRANVLKIKPAKPKELRILTLHSGQHHVLLRCLNLAVPVAGTKRVIALGDNKFGQANCFQFDEDVEQVALGWTHNAVLLKDKRLYTWGRNNYGQLGIGSTSEPELAPVEVDLPEEVSPARISLGAEHGLLRSSDGKVYTWGWNEHGNCGNKSISNVLKPTLIPLPGSCKLACASAGFCYAICDSDIKA